MQLYKEKLFFLSNVSTVANEGTCVPFYLPTANVFSAMHWAHWSCTVGLFRQSMRESGSNKVWKFFLHLNIIIGLYQGSLFWLQPVHSRHHFFHKGSAN